MNIRINLIKKLLAITILLFFPSNYILAKSNTNKDLKNKLESSDFKEKSKAITQLKNKAKDDKEAKKILIDYLKQEIDSINKNGAKKYYSKEKGEGQIEVLAQLLSTVAEFKDPLTVNTLVDSLITGNHLKSVEEALISYGDNSIQPLLEKLGQEDIDIMGRTEIMIVLNNVVKSPGIDKKNIKSVRKKYIELLEDKEPFVRKWAIIGLGEFGDIEDVKLLEKIAKQDTNSRYIDAAFRGGKEGEKLKIYPIREEAKKALEKIELKKEKKVE